VLRSPIGFEEGWDALLFFGSLAFGLRTSLFDLFCPLAICGPFQLPAPRIRQAAGGRPGVEVLLLLIEHYCTLKPSISAAVKRRTLMFAHHCGSPQSVIARQNAASLCTIFRSSHH
jgi:hypothetical protein